MSKKKKTFYPKYFPLFSLFPLLIYLGKRSPIVFDEGYYILQSKWILNTGDWNVLGQFTVR